MVLLLPEPALSHHMSIHFAEGACVSGPLFCRAVFIPSTLTGILSGPFFFAGPYFFPSILTGSFFPVACLEGPFSFPVLLTGIVSGPLAGQY